MKKSLILKVACSELWYKQSFADDLFWFKVGRNDCSLYFDYANNGTYFQNGGFEGLATICTLPSYPNPAMSVIVGSTPVDFIALKAGLFDGSLIQGVQIGAIGIFGNFFDNLAGHAFMIGQMDFSWNFKAGLNGRIRVGDWGACCPCSEVRRRHCQRSSGWVYCHRSDCMEEVAVR